MKLEYIDYKIGDIEIEREAATTFRLRYAGGQSYSKCMSAALAYARGKGASAALLAMIKGNIVWSLKHQCLCPLMESLI